MRAGRFESLGVRGLYAWVAGIVREPMLPGTRDPQPEVSAARLAEQRVKARYFWAANLARAACYVPQAIAFVLVKYWPGLGYVLAIWILHGLMMLVESYKSSLVEHWLPEASILDEEPEEPRPEQPPALFVLRSFETEEFYRRLGLEWFRRFSTWIMSTLTYGWNSERLTFIDKPSRKQLVVFERETRMSEAVHWVSAVSVAPLVVFSWLGAPLGIAVWSSVIVLGDVLLALLQRYHRSRVWPIIKRSLERSA